MEYKNIAAAKRCLGLLECEKCGSRKNVELHHPDYDKPWEVEPLCLTCHRAWHGLLRRIIRKCKEKGLL